MLIIARRRSAHHWTVVYQAWTFYRDWTFVLRSQSASATDFLPALTV